MVICRTDICFQATEGHTDQPAKPLSREAKPNTESPINRKATRETAQSRGKPQIDPGNTLICRTHWLLN